MYVARNPKDVIVSYYYHHKLMKLIDYKGDFEEFAQYFLDDESKYFIYCNVYYKNALGNVYIYIYIFNGSFVFSILPTFA